VHDPLVDSTDAFAGFADPTAIAEIKTSGMPLTGYLL